jgi:hypothetical protein
MIELISIVFGTMCAGSLLIFAACWIGGIRREIQIRENEDA